MEKQNILSGEVTMLELHVHLDGSLRPSTVWELAEKQGIFLAADIQELESLMAVPEG